MMYSRLFILLILFNSGLLTTGQAQYAYFQPDKKFKYSYKTFVDSLHIEDPDFKKINLELRIWRLNWSNGENTVIQLQQHKDLRWLCVKRNFLFYDEENYVIENSADTFALKDSWGKSWTEIIEANYLHLPDQKELNKAIRLPYGQQLHITDGQSFTIEILAADKKRKFTYANPIEHWRFYKENGVEVMAYKRFATFMKILESELNL